MSRPQPDPNLVSPSTNMLRSCRYIYGIKKKEEEEEREGPVKGRRRAHVFGFEPSCCDRPSPFIRRMC